MKDNDNGRWDDPCFGDVVEVEELLLRFERYLRPKHHDTDSRLVDLTMAALVAHRSFLNDVLDRQSQRRAEIDPSHSFPAQPSISSSSKRPPPSDLDVKTKANVVNYVQEEETIRNDYTTWYGVSGQVGTNFILGANDGEICEE